MIERMLDFDDNHHVWKLADKAIELHVCFWDVSGDNKDTEEYVNAMGACSDFLYGLNTLDRLRFIPAVPEVDLVAITESVKTDEDVKALVTKCARAYLHYSGTGEFGDDGGFRQNCDTINSFYQYLIFNGYVKHYEIVTYTRTITKMKL